MDCSTWFESISAGLDGELSEAERESLDAHLAVCPACRATERELEREHRAFRLRPATMVPAPSRDLLAITAAPGQDTRWRMALVAVAATVVIVVVGAVVIAGQGASALPEVSVSDVRASAGRAGGVAAVYLYLGNDGGADRVVDVTSPLADRVDLHRLEDVDGVSTMQAISFLPVPGDGATELAPGGSHVMLIGLREHLEPGDIVPLTLSFARSDPIQVDALVEDALALAA